MVNKSMKAIELLYRDKCTIVEYKPIKDPVSKRTNNKEVIVLENQPCKLSYKNITSTADGKVAKLEQTIKLFISPDIEIKAGSKLIITNQNNVTKEYIRSGETAIYPNHQEVILELLEDKA
ncbi:putative phage protein [Clostridioides difficile CD160]|nr:putative phage protein [Clostridioides difficile CD160]